MIPNDRLLSEKIFQFPSYIPASSGAVRSGFHSYYEKSLGTDVDLFSKSRGEAWFYDKGNADQQT